MTDALLDTSLLIRLARRNNFAIPADDLVFFGIRGMLPIDISGTRFGTSHLLRSADIDNLRMRCTLGQLRPAGDTLAVFPGSTVPSLPNIKSAKANRGLGANMLMLGRYKFERGVHKLGRPSGHRAFRQSVFFPVWRTSDDLDYDLDDVADLDGGIVFDNLHCAYHDNLDTAGFSSAGCQVVCGHPKSPARDNRPETGPWRRFIDNAYDALSPQANYTYMLFSGTEVAMVASQPDSKVTQSLRFGSSGDLVREAQKCLIAKGMPLEPPDGDFGRATIEAVMAFQAREFGRGSADGVIGPNTAQALGFVLPKLGDVEATNAASPLVRVSVDAVDALAEAGSEPHRIAIARDGDDWFASVDATPRFYVGRSVKFGSFRGIFQPGGKLDELPGGKYDSAGWSGKLGARGPWALFLEPTIIGESGGHLSRVNTYDGAGLTFGPLQFASHTPRDNLILLFRALLKRPDAPRWFPELTLVGGKVHRKTATGAISLETEGPNGRLTDFMEYLNPDAVSVSEREVESAARLMGWSLASDDFVQTQLELAIERFSARINRLGTAYGVDLPGRDIGNLIWVGDILHHGRGSYAKIKAAINSASPAASLEAIGGGDPRWKDRVAAVKAAIARVRGSLDGEKWGSGAFAI
jgi:hypothetical protein